MRQLLFLFKLFQALNVPRTYNNFFVEVDMCQVPPLCHANASCSTIHDPTVVKNCSCLPGYHGDGYVCDPVNPCQVENGGCPEQSTTCVMDAPGQVFILKVLNFQKPKILL